MRRKETLRHPWQIAELGTAYSFFALPQISPPAFCQIHIDHLLSPTAAATSDKRGYTRLWHVDKKDHVRFIWRLVTREFKINHFINDHYTCRYNAICACNMLILATARGRSI